VGFDIDANGILHVGAKDLGTGKEQKITITASSGLSKDDIGRMQRDAEMHAEEDRRKREEIEARNEADNAVYRSEKMLRENQGKISEDDRRKIEEAVGAVKEALKGEEASAIKSASDKLNEVWQAVSSELYRAASERAAGARGGGAQTGPGPEEGGKRPEGDVVEAEVVEDEGHKA
jgi:molecular chaperone DnaK